MSLSPQNSFERREDILKHSNEVLANLPQAYGSQSFILSDHEATEIGEAVHSRNHRAIYDIIGSVLDSAVDDFKATPAQECIGIWNQTFESIYGEGITLVDLLANDATRELLNNGLTSSESTQLGLDTTEYLKLLETIAIATIPDKGFRNPPESRRSRVGGTSSALFYRSVSLLNFFADATPGIRTMREDILNTDAQALSKYLTSKVKEYSARESLTMLIEMNEHDIRRKKAELERTLNDEGAEHDSSIEDLLHVLEWKILPGSEDDRDTKRARIKKIIEGQSQTERQRRQLESDWCPERLDFLIEIAETAMKDGRHPKMLISNRFEEGRGVYVGVELDNPYDPTKKMLFADNPILNNALYMVDEARLENEGRPNEWQNVLGANRRIARERGATRRYHTKNWQDILPQVMRMGDAPDPDATPIREVKTQLPLKTDDSELINASRELQNRIQAMIVASRNLLK